MNPTFRGEIELATFFNQASLSINGTVTNSNIVTGEITQAITAAKTAVTDEYRAGDPVTYVINLANTDAVAYNGLTVSDNLGAYTIGTTTAYPLTYVDDSVKLYVNGVLQAAPTVTAGPPLQFSGINIPANGSAVLVYQGTVNRFAPLDGDGAIVNEATVDGAGLTAPIAASADARAAAAPNLEISKSISPAVVSENGQITYTFLIQNNGNEAAALTDDTVLSDTFDPVLRNISVTFNGSAWAPTTNYTYDETTGAFATVPGQVTVPAATYTQNPDTGEWSVTPGISTMTVTGTI